MPTLDLIVMAAWVGALSLAIVAQAVLLYIRHRMATRRAEGAARLAEAIAFPPGGRRGVGPAPHGRPAAGQAAPGRSSEARTS